ncbi:MAG: site-specific integrase [Lacrimispora sp.]
MPRKGENIYKRKDGRWEGRQLKEEGKYQYFYGKSYREVKEKVRNFLENKKSFEKTNKKQGQKASAQFEAWLEGEILDRVKPSTYESYYNCTKKYVIPFFSRSENERITADSVSRFIRALKNEASISETYKKKILGVFKTALRELLKNSPDSPVILELIKLPKTEENEVQIFTRKEQGLIEMAALNYEDKRALGIVLCFYSGIRLGELCALRWSDFDIEAGTMSIKRTVSRTKSFNSSDSKTVLNIGTPKSRTSSRTIPLPDFLINIAKRYMLQGEKEGYYVLSGTDTPMDPRAYQKLYKRILIKAGVKDRKFHAIRHTFATRALELHVDIKTVSEILGHSNVAITMNVYVHSLMEQKKIAIEKFNSMHISSMEHTVSAVISSVKHA